MTPEQLGNLAASLRAALVIVEGAKDRTPSSVSEVGGEDDPIRVRFERIGSKITYTCLHMDESLRGKGRFFTNTDGFILYSSNSPTIFGDSLFVRGANRKSDLRMDEVKHDTPLQATVLIARASAAVAAFNAQWRAEKANPTLEQDIDKVRRSLAYLSNGSGDAFERIVARVK